MSEITDAFVDLSPRDIVNPNEIPCEDIGSSRIYSVEPELADEIKEPPKDERLDKAREINREVRQRREEYLDSAEETKELKKIFEAAQTRLSAYLTSLDTPPDPQQVLPFKDEPVEPDAWRDFPLTDVAGFPAAVLSALEATEVRTMGELADWSAFKKFVDLPGVGPATADKADAALLGFWAAHPEFTKTPPPPEPKEAPRDAIGEAIASQEVESTVPAPTLVVVSPEASSEKPRRGRPPGSRNKPKQSATAARADELTTESIRAADLRIAESLLGSPTIFPIGG